MKRALVFLVAFLLPAVLLAGNPAPRPVEVPSDKVIRKERPIPNQFVVLVKDGVDPEDIARQLKYSKVDHIYREALNGFAGWIEPTDLDYLSTLDEVLFIEEDAEVTTQETQQAGATWGLDRIDQRYLNLDGSYWYYPNIANPTGSVTVRAYVIDSGISPHANFGGRFLFGPGQGFTVIFDGNGIFGCPTPNGEHGTHVAGTIGSNTWGVSKQVVLHSVRVLDCNGFGTISGVIAGINWVAANHIKPAVANLSLGGSYSPALNTAVDNLVSVGVFASVAAGNSNANACNFSPASAVQAYTVGATTNTDLRASFSNWGSCVDIFAPGQGITSTVVGGGTAVKNGTSMAAPHVAGAAALYLAEYPWATSGQVRQAVTTTSTVGALGTNIGTGSPNLLLYSRAGSLMGFLPGTITAQYQQQVQPRGVAYFAKFAGPHEGRLIAVGGTNFDLELYEYDPILQAFLLVAGSYSSGSTEHVIYHGTETLYYWVVTSAVGTGAYQLRTSQP